MHYKEQRRIISEIYFFIFQSKFNNPPYHDRVTEKSGTSKNIQWDFQISKVGSLDFLDLKVNGSPEELNKYIWSFHEPELEMSDTVTLHW